jgi:cobalt-zinc-cadmium efflux system membrane fusion protein
MIRTISVFAQFLFIAAFISGGCHGGGEEGTGEPSSAEMSPAEAMEEIVITRPQFEASEMRLGSSETFTFRQVVKANGYIEASPQGIARVSTLVPARITAIYVTVGDQVVKGQRLFAMEGNELIILQQDYAESLGMLNLLRSTYERQQALAEADISARKELVRAENEYHSMRARVGGLKAQLMLLQIDPEKVAAGNIQQGVQLSSPVSGYITELDLMLGQVIEPNESVMEIVDPGQLQLNVQVYENSLDVLAPGQKIRFYKPEHPGKVFEASLHSVGRSVDSEARTIHCIATLDKADGQQFIHGLFVEAEIITCERDAEAIPQAALIVEHEKQYVLVKSGEKEDQMVFQKRPVGIGVIQQGFAELTEGALKDVLIEGSYNIAGE